MPEYSKIIWSDMTEKQRDAVKLFEAGKFMYGEEEHHIATLKDLHKANSWIMWQCNDDYRPGVVAAIQHSLIIPAFQAHVLRITRDARLQDRTEV